MSSNDQLIIRKHKGKFEIYHNLCVDNNFHYDKKSLISTKENIEDAIKFANDYCRKDMVEYGTYIDDSTLGEKK